MSVVWHRLGKEHPLVQQLDRLSGEQSRCLCTRRRAHQGKAPNSDVLRELEAERTQLADERAALERAIRKLAASQMTTRSSTAVRVARTHLANVLAQRVQKQPTRRRDASTG